MTALLLLLTMGQAPAFTVDNKCPPKFTVVNALKVEIDPWKRVYDRVMAGETILTENIPGQPRGRYKCFLLNGVPTFQAVSEVTAPKTFLIKHEGHDCPNCGRSQYRISGWLPDGDHIHRCSSCGTAWSH